MDDGIIHPRNRVFFTIDRLNSKAVFGVHELTDSLKVVGALSASNGNSRIFFDTTELQNCNLE